MRKFLNPKFWSLGTHLGYLGPLSQKKLDRIFSKLVFLTPTHVNESPGIVVACGQTKNLDRLPT